MLANPGARDEFAYWEKWYEIAHNCPPDPAYLKLAQMLQDAGHHIIILTARPVDIVAPTYIWLEENEVAYDSLKMSPGGDGVFHHSKEAHLVRLKDEFNIRLAFDDSQYWVDMFRRHKVPAIWVNHGLKSIAQA